eukprot:3218012-Amphidinium_carterae.1
MAADGSKLRGTNKKCAINLAIALAVASAAESVQTVARHTHAESLSVVHSAGASTTHAVNGKGAGADAN